MRFAIVLLAIALTASAKKNDNNGRGNAYGHTKHEIPTAEVPEPASALLLLGGAAALFGVRAIVRGRR